MRFLVTGSAGFIGYHLSRRLLGDGHVVVGYDALNEYYDPKLKRARLKKLAGFPAFTQIEANLEDSEALDRAGDLARPDVIVHLAAQAGVRYSIENPRAYIDSNLVGSFNILELARRLRPGHTLLASSSSVYGGNSKMPFTEAEQADLPITLYAASKKSMEMMSHSYSHLFDLPMTCLRFFTVYGPWGRPDMALFKFVAAAVKGKPIDVYGQGAMRRDFTYIDDVVEAVNRLVGVVPEMGSPVAGGDTLSPVAPWRCVNIAGGTPVELGEFISAIESALGRPVQRNLLPMQPGDVRETYADHRLLLALTGYQPATPVAVGVKEFVDWWRLSWRGTQGHP